MMFERDWEIAGAREERCRRRGKRGFALLAVAALLACGLVGVSPAPAGAAFARHFLRALASAGSGPLTPSGIAVDGEDNLWVQSARDSLVGFAPAFAPGENQLLETIPATPPIVGPDRLDQLAIQHESKDFYVTGETVATGEPGGVVVYNRLGVIQREWGEFKGGTIAIDNSPTGSLEDPSACGTTPLAPGECFVYVTTAGETGGIEKFDSKGNPVPFATSAAYITDSIKGNKTNNKITGIPGHETGVFGQGGLNAIAVDSEGNIYADNASVHAVYEYAPSGSFVQEFSLAASEVPRLGERVVEPTGVAFDQVSKHLLVAVLASGLGLGAIDEFEPKTGKFIAETTEAALGVALEKPGQIAVDSTGDVYVREREQDLIDVYGSGRFVPTVTIAAAAQRTGKTALLAGSVNPEGFKLTECGFQYASEEAFSKEGFAKATTAECKPGAGEIPPDKQTHAVTAAIAGLTAGVTYRYRLLAHSEGELGGTAETPALAFTTLALPAILSSAATSVSSTGAELDAQIKPDGAATSYHFEYDTRPYTSEEHHGISIPIPDANIGAGGPTGGATESVTQQAEGLTPGSEYHLRVIAVNQTGTVYSPDKTFTTLPAPSPILPDNRAYELVTPAAKEGGSDMFAEPETDHEFFNANDLATPALAADGLELGTHSTFGAFPGAFTSSYVLQRKSPPNGGWGFTSLESPARGVQSISEVLFDPLDLSRVALQDRVGSEAGGQGASPVDLLGAPGGPYTTLHEDPSHSSHSVGEAPATAVAGGSSDLSHVVLDSNTTSTCGPEVAAKKILQGDELCEWDGGVETLEGGETRPALGLVNLAPGSETQPVSSCGALLGQGRQGGLARNAVSADGRRVIFTAPQPESKERGVPLAGPGCWNHKQEQETGNAFNPPQLYVRLSGQTVKLSASAAGVLEGGKAPREYPAAYAGASEDATRVFFVSEAWLTSDHPAVHDPELYECDLVVEGEAPACKLTRVSIPAGEHGEANPNAGAAVDWVPAIANDGNAVYYTAFAVLAAGATPQTLATSDEEGKVNVYRYDTSSLETSFVATVDTQDHTNQNRCEGVVLAAVGRCSQADWYTTPNGKFLLFGASLPVAGFNVVRAGCVAHLPFQQGGFDGSCSELYRFDAAAAERGDKAVVCVSCGPGGVDAAGNAEFARSASSGAGSGPPAGISDDGSYVFFDSPARLVPEAVNHTLDVYEWQASGVGGCVLANGCVRLLSSPNDPAPSYFLGSSPFYTPSGRKVEGGNVFIGTHAQLVAQDTNALGDIYDVRICDVESPCIKAPVGGTLQCEGGSCQHPPAAPNDVNLASLAFSGAGNIVSAPPPPAGHVLTNAQKLARALRACRKDRSKRKRVACVRAAHHRYPVKKAKKSARGGGSDA